MGFFSSRSDVIGVQRLVSCEQLPAFGEMQYDATQKMAVELFLF
jgi:hypothetical protein